jgi:lipopolysaccharide/colanic/teichoic acid biosynthesis glycosyltransferase
MIALRLTGEGEIFYVQERLGLKNTRFGILKFATMLKDSPNIGTRSITLPGDPRVLPFGKFLRKTKINELPQLFNVLRGDMSIVGPRPLVPEIFEVFPPELQAHVYDSKPGLTGIGSIIFRDEESLFAETNLEPKVFYRQVIAPYKGALELWYGENRSMWTDLKIVLTTAWVILFPKSNLPNRLFKSLPQRSS